MWIQRHIQSILNWTCKRTAFFPTIPIAHIILSLSLSRFRLRIHFIYSKLIFPSVRCALTLLFWFDDKWPIHIFTQQRVYTIGDSNSGQNVINWCNSAYSTHTLTKCTWAEPKQPSSASPNDHCSCGMYSKNQSFQESSPRFHEDMNRYFGSSWIVLLLARK